MTTSKNRLELTVAERIWLMNLLPLVGGRIKMMLVRDIMRQIEFTPDEVSQLRMKELMDGSVRYDYKVAETIQIAVELTKEQLLAIKEGIDQADREQRIPYKALELIERVEKLLPKKRKG